MPFRVIHYLPPKSYQLHLPVATYKNSVTFAIISAVYVLTRAIIFKGFNGTDDLHYAMLAANMLKGKYNQFVPGDIFSGRVLLIALQALFYRLAGINAVTTQTPAILAVLISCRLTVFNLLKSRGSAAVVITSSLFYFNPVLTYATDGILPDVYIMLSTIITLLLWNRSMMVPNVRKNMLFGACMAITVTAAMFFKETALVLPVLFIGLALARRSKAAIITCTVFLAVLLAASVISGAVYYHFTGDAFFRMKQVHNSNYYNPCSYDLLPAKFLVIRLTYGVWKLFLTYGFYPVIFAAGIICSLPFGKRGVYLQVNAVSCFLLLLAIGLYFPFSLNGYQPLCSDSARHFLFLLPPAVWVCAPGLTSDATQYKTTKWIAGCCLSLGLCIASTPDKWQWMVWGLLVIFFTAQKFITSILFTRHRPFIFASILWLCMPYRLFYNNSNWFANMRRLNNQLAGNHYYFVDHDNMMHWQLLHGFADTLHCYNLATAPVKMFGLYYEKPDTAMFNSGWLIINNKYTERTENFFHTIDSLDATHYFSKRIVVGDMQAVYISLPGQLNFIRGAAESDEKVVE